MNHKLNLFLFASLTYATVAAQHSPAARENRATFSVGPSSPTETLLDLLQRQQADKYRLTIVPEQNLLVAQAAIMPANEADATAQAEQPGLPKTNNPNIPAMIRNSPAAHAKYLDDTQNQDLVGSLFNEVATQMEILQRIHKAQSQLNQEHASALSELSRLYKKLLRLHNR